MSNHVMHDAADPCATPLLLDGATVTFGTGQRRLTVLDDLTLVVPPRSLICVAGRSGSGKTTVLKVAHGVLRPDHGEVLWNGQPITRLDPDELALRRRGHVGYVPQDAGLIPSMSAIENVLVPKMPTRIDRHDIARAESLLAQLGLTGRANNHPSALSGGERQRVALARALMNEPTIVIADEPTSGLDRRTADTVIQILCDLAEDHAVLVATHDPNLITAATWTHEMETGGFELSS